MDMSTPYQTLSVALQYIHETLDELHLEEGKIYREMYMNDPTLNPSSIVNTIDVHNPRFAQLSAIRKSIEVVTKIRDTIHELAVESKTEEEILEEEKFRKNAIRTLKSLGL